jgi:hypothetical protein
MSLDGPLLVPVSTYSRPLRLFGCEQVRAATLRADLLLPGCLASAISVDECQWGS